MGLGVYTVWGMVSSENFKRILKSMNSSESNFVHAGILWTPRNLTKLVGYRVKLGSYILCFTNYSTVWFT